MSLPIPIITENFEKFYKEQHKKEKASKRKHRLKSAKKHEETARLEEVGGCIEGFGKDTASTSVGGIESSSFFKALKSPSSSRSNPRSPKTPSSSK